jgi:hypothetical protein
MVPYFEAWVRVGRGNPHTKKLCIIDMVISRYISEYMRYKYF